MMKNSIRQKLHLSKLIAQSRLYPSSTGLLHGVREVKKRGSFLYISTKCGINLRARNSKEGRASRWLRKGWYRRVCKACKIPVKKI